MIIKCICSTLLVQSLLLCPILCADDATGFGVADDFLLPEAIVCFCYGLDGVVGKQVCTECGEVMYGF